MKCNDATLNIILYPIKNIMNIILIVAPILAIISLTVWFTTLLTDPENKKMPNKIKNSLIALVIVFFIPVIVNLVMSMLGESTSVSSCYNNAIKPEMASKYYKTDDIDKVDDTNTNTDANSKTSKKNKTKNKNNTNDSADTTITSCGDLKYCNKFLTSLYNNSKKLKNAIINSNATVIYNYKRSARSWNAAINIAQRGGVVATTCVVPANWGITDAIGKHKTVYSEGKGGFHNYSGKITKYTKQYKYDGSMSVKTAIQKGIIQPGDIIGVKAHTFAIYSINKKKGSAVVADGGHMFTNKCQKSKKCSTLFTYSAGTNGRTKLYQLIRWVK